MRCRCLRPFYASNDQRPLLEIATEGSFTYHEVKAAVTTIFFKRTTIKVSGALGIL